MTNWTVVRCPSGFTRCSRRLLTTDPWQLPVRHSGFVIRHSFVIRISSFVILAVGPTSKESDEFRMAGHSHFANIAAKKGANDKKRGALFGKLSRAIMIAARHGGG